MLILRPNVDVAPIPDGVYFSAPTSQFVLKGWSGLYQIAYVCVQLLASGTTEANLVEVLGTSKAKPVVRRILQGLMDHGMLVTRNDDGHAEARPREQGDGALAFLEAVSGKPHEVSGRLRRARLAVRGLPAGGAAVVSALLKAGLGQVDWSASDRDVDIDGVLCCVARPEDLASITAPGGAETVVMPVLLGDILRVAGPAVSLTDLPKVIEIWKRADRWRDDTAPVAGGAPIADALTLDFAGHLLFDALADLATDTLVVVHGDPLAADRSVCAARSMMASWTRHRLETVSSTEVANPQVLAAMVDVSRRWTGLFTSGSGEKMLPQMPLALRQITLREGPRETVASWGADQESATMAIAVDGLRMMGAAPAGLTAERWLVDGVLRLLIDEVEYMGDLAHPRHDDADGRRICRELEVLGMGELHSTVNVLPGVDWPMVSAHDNSGVMLAAAWAEDEKRAGFEALATVLANQQLTAVGQTSTMTRLRTGRLVYGDSERIAQLRKQLCDYLARTGRRAEGRLSGPDPVLGQLPFWTGPVQLIPTERAFP